MNISEIQWQFYPHVAQHTQARRWIEILVMLQKTPKTIDAYARNLDDFLRLCECWAISVVDADRGDIARYINEMARRRIPNRGINGEHGLSNATMQQHLTAVRLFYDYLIDCDQRSTNPIGRGRYTRGTGFYSTQPRALLKPVEQQPWIPGDDQWYHFLDVVLREECLRNQVMVFMSYDGALRRSELVALTPFDIDLSHRHITIRPEVAKNGAGRVVFFSDITSQLYLEYLYERRALLLQIGGKATGPLFVSESNRNVGLPVTVDAWNKAVQRMARRAGLPQLHPHTFRHLRLTHFARYHLETYEIALLAGHRSLTTTRLYLHLDKSELGHRVYTAMQEHDERIKRFVEERKQHHETSNG